MGTRLVQHFGADEADLVFGACADNSPTRPLFEVTGQMLQPGDVYLGGGGDSGSTSPWQFSLAAFADTYDLVATDGALRSDARISIRRGLAIETDTVLPALDLAQGSPLETATFSVDGLDGDRMSSIVTLVTSGGWPATVSVSNTKQVQIAPRDVLVASDLQTLEVSARRDDLGSMTLRTTRATVGGTTPAISLLPPLSADVFEEEGKAVDPGAVTFSDYGVVASAILGKSANGRLVDLRVSASREWITLNATQLVRFDDSAPSIDPMWIIVDVAGYAAEVVLEEAEDFHATALLVNTPVR
ncbi:MAG: hypothetical protein ABI867_31225 [Kofleriaceae bacterium]